MAHPYFGMQKYKKIHTNYLSASDGQRKAKILKVNVNNRSERAEHIKYQSEIRCKSSEKLTLTLNWQDLQSRKNRKKLTKTSQCIGNCLS